MLAPEGLLGFQGSWSGHIPARPQAQELPGGLGPTLDPCPPSFHPESTLPWQLSDGAAAALSPGLAIGSGSGSADPGAGERPADSWRGPPQEQPDGELYRFVHGASTPWVQHRCISRVRLVKPQALHPWHQLCLSRCRHRECCSPWQTVASKAGNGIRCRPHALSACLTSLVAHNVLLRQICRAVTGRCRVGFGVVWGG